MDIDAKRLNSEVLEPSLIFIPMFGGCWRRSMLRLLTNAYIALGSLNVQTQLTLSRHNLLASS